MNRQPVSRVRRQNQINVKDRYNEAHKRYVSSEFTYNSHCLLRKLCENGEKQPNLYNVPLYKIITEITKIMMMNQLELLFFGATVQEMKWKVIQTCLTPYLDEVTDITPKLTKDILAKKMQLSLLLIAYIVKIYLNEDSQLYDFKIRDLIKINFDKMYQQWVQKVQNNFKFSPKHMNKLFKQLDKGKKKIKQDIIDYNQLVTELCKNSPDEQKPYSERVNMQLSRGQQRQKVQQHYHQSGNKMQGVPVHQDDEQYKVPTLHDRISGRSQVSNLGFGKKQSYHQLFEKGQIKPERGFSTLGLNRNFSQEEDFFNGGNL